MLKFFRGNKKLGDEIYTFSLPAGHSCPFAKVCLSKADRQTGKIKDAERIEFRCYAASMESLRTNVREASWHNFNLLRGKTKTELVKLLLLSLPLEAKIVRIHISGEFFSQDYFDAWLAIAREKPNVLFYAYTKALPYWIKRLNQIPKNFILTASIGGTHDYLIDLHGLKSVRVVFSEEEADELGLELDFDDSHAIEDKDFALLVHGIQPKAVNQRMKLQVEV